MPAAILAWAAQSWVVSAGIFAAGSLGASIVGISTALVVGQIQGNAAQRRAQRDAVASYNASLQDRKTVIRSPILPRNMILGQDRASGMLWPWFTWGDKRQYHTFAVTFAGHECDSVVTHYFNGDALTLDGDGYVTTPKWCRTEVVAVSEAITFDGSGNATLTYIPVGTSGSSAVVSGGSTGAVEGNVLPLTFSGTTAVSGGIALAGRDGTANYSREIVTPLFRIWTYLGGSGQAASPELIAAAAAAGVPSSWDSTRKGTGVAYSVIQMEADFNVLGQIGVPNYSVLAKGVKAYDPRTATTAWTQNPTVLARWYMVQSGYTPKTLTGEIGSTEYTASANVCDESVAFSASRTEARYQCNGQLTTDANPIDNLNHILDSMDGEAVWIAGAWQLVAGYYRTPDLTINESTLSEATITIAPTTPKDRLFNMLTGTFVDASKGYVRTSYQAVTSSTYQTQDGDEVLPQQMDFALVNDDVRCQMIAWQRLQRARQQMVVQLGTSLKGYNTWPTQNVLLSLNEFGFSAQPMTVMSRTLQDGKLLYTLQKTSSAVWAWTYAIAGAAVVTPNTSLPETTVPSLQSFRATSGTEALIEVADTVQSRIHLYWAPVLNDYVVNGGRIEAQARPLGSDTWSIAETALGAATEMYIGPVTDAVTYEIRGRAVNGLGRDGPWFPLYHTVIGQTERPTAPTNFNVIASGGRAFFAWDLHPALDVKAGGYIVIRHSPLTTGATWEGGYIIDTFPGRSVGGAGALITGTYMAKAKDYSGNWSESFASFLATEGMVTGFTTVTTTTQDTTYTGSKTNTVATDNILKLDSTTLIDDMGAIDDVGYIDAIGGISATGTYLFDTYVDCTTVLVRRAEADLKVLSFDTDDLIDSRTALIDEWDAIDGAEINTCDVTLYARTTNDNPAGSPTWGAWTEFMVADFNCRAFQFKALLTSSFPTHNIQVETLRVAVKVPV